MLKKIRGQLVTFAALHMEFDMQDLARTLWIDGADRWTPEGCYDEAAICGAFESAVADRIGIMPPVCLAFGAQKWAFSFFKAGWDTATQGALKRSGDDTRELS